MQIDK